MRGARPPVAARVAAAASRLAALVLLAALAACGVKAPPKAAGAPEKSPPSDVFQPPREPRP